MKRLLLLAGAGLLSVSNLFAQDISVVYSTEGADDWIVLRDVEKISSNELIVGFDYHPDATTMPKAGIMKTDNWGNVLWSKTYDFESAAASCSFEVKQNSEGNFYLWGLKADAASSDMYAILSEIGPTGDVLWTKQYNLGFNTGIYTVNDMELLSGGNMQMMMTVYDENFVMEVDPDGDIVWGHRSSVDTLGGGKNPGYDWRPRPGGGGWCSGKRTNDFSLNAYDSAGNLEWNKSYSLGSYNHITALMDLPSGNVMAAGYAFPSSSPSYVPVVMEIDGTDGSLVWIKQLSGVPAFYQSSVQLMEDGDDIIMIIDEHGIPSNNQTFIKIDDAGNVIEAMVSQPDLDMMDYNKVVVESSSEHYNVGAFRSPATDSVFQGLLDKRTSLFDETCILTTLSGVTSSDFTDVDDTIFTPVETDYSDVSSVSATASDIQLTKEWACEVLSDEEAITEPISLDVYPNPADGNVNVVIAGEFSFILTDLNGRIIETGNAKDAVEIDLSKLQSGIYALTVNQADNSYVNKIVKR